MVTTHVGKRVVCENYYVKYSVQIGVLQMPADLIVLAMYDYDVILGMDWLARYRACADCIHKTFTFMAEEPNSNVIFEGIRRKKSSTGLVSALNAEKLLETRCRGYIAFVTKNKPLKKLEQISIVCKLPDVFLDEIPSLPSSREEDFPIDLVPGTAPISKAPYRMVPIELWELKTQLQELLDK